MMKRRAGAVIPRRPSDGYVLVGRRTHAARSYPDYLAFPGGGVDDTDVGLPLMAQAAGEAEHVARACAMRELGEETGRWLLCDDAGAPLSVHAAQRFSAGFGAEVDLAALLQEVGARFDDRNLIALSEWVTQDARPKTFFVRQFLLHTDDDDPMMVRTECLEELSGVRWRAPAAIFDAWGAGGELLLPPIRHVVTTLVRAGEASVATLVEQLKRVRPAAVPETHDIIQGIYVQPYRTPTLPPATHTNTVLVGCRDYFIIDPATPYDDERAQFDGALSLLRAQGRKPRAVLATHHHPDHIGDVRRVCEKYGLELWCDPVTAEALGGASRILVDGDEISPDGGERNLRVIATPGHADGHLCYLETVTNTLIAGDMVATMGSILIDPPEGKMGLYLAHLERLADLHVGALIPSHGPLIGAGEGKLREQIAHRQRRQAGVMKALAEAGDAEPMDLVPAIYGADTPRAMWPFAARSVLAGLLWAVELGTAEQRDGRFFMAAGRNG